MKCQTIFGTVLITTAAEYDLNYSQQEAKDWGRLVELYLSHIIHNTPVSTIREWQYHLKECYGNIKMECSWYEKILSGLISCETDTCLLNIPDTSGRYHLQEIKKELLIETFDFCREGF